MAHDVFISHSAKDKVTADAVCAMLESEGIRCWIAPRDVLPSMEWGEAIVDALEESRIMVLVFTANANASPQIRREVERAVNCGVAILPLRIEDVLPARGLDYFIGNLHWLDALTPPLEAHLKNLAGTIKILQARREQRNPLPPRAAAVEWPLANLSEHSAAQSISEEGGEPKEPHATLPVGKSEEPVAAVERISKESVPLQTGIHLAGPGSHPTPSELAPALTEFASDAAASSEVPEVEAVPNPSKLQETLPLFQSQPVEVEGKKMRSPLRWLIPITGGVVLVIALIVLSTGLNRQKPWTVRNSGTLADLASVVGTSDGKRLWTVGGWGTILESDDGGITWTGRNSGTQNTLQTIFATVDGGQLWIVGDWGTILESDDGGATWRKRISGTQDALESIFGTSNGKRLWAVGARGTILESDDGGASWTGRDSGTSNPLYAIFGSGDGKRLWVVGANGTVLESVDIGKTWTARPSGTSADLKSVTGTRDGAQLWAVGFSILVSHDGGATWTEHPRGVGPLLNAVFGTSDVKRLWFVGDEGTILESDDGGITFLPRRSDTHRTLWSIFGTDDGNRAWAVGANGTILESPAPDR